MTSLNNDQQPRDDAHDGSVSREPRVRYPRWVNCHPTHDVVFTEEMADAAPVGAAFSVLALFSPIGKRVPLSVMKLEDGTWEVQYRRGISSARLVGSLVTPRRRAGNSKDVEPGAMG